MKIRILRRVALQKTYEFIEIETSEIKNTKQAIDALEQHEALALYAREVEVSNPKFSQLMKIKNGELD